MLEQPTQNLRITLYLTPENKKKLDLISKGNRTKLINEAIEKFVEGQQREIKKAELLDMLDNFPLYEPVEDSREIIIEERNRRAAFEEYNVTESKKKEGLYKQNIAQKGSSSREDKLIASVKLGHEKSGFPSFYDSTYHAIAILNNCNFVTSDKKHYDKTKGLGHIELFNNI